MATTEGFAPAKINLTLHVTGQRGDGYHLLDSLVVFAAVGDALRFDPAPAMALTVTGPFAAGVPVDARNLVWRAAEAAGWAGHIVLQKNLPHGAGIGGGSADAAAVLRHLGRPEMAAGLGADVAVCLSDFPQRMQGVGEVLSPAPHVPALDLVLVNAGGHVATPAVFAALTGKDNAAMGAFPHWENHADFLSWLAAQRNDLEIAASTLAPQIGATLAALTGAELARMSGSGGTCFGIYPHAQTARAAADRIAAQHPDWWVVATKTIGRAGLN